jgi:tRNA threonylcarbamoyladenosine biosynthesis protein TsaE
MEKRQLMLETESVAQTQALGLRLASWLRSGDVLALAGELGAGKTAFTQGLARGMGITVAVTSPTFVLINRYMAPDGRVLQHVDCYRLADAPAEMWDIGLSDLFAGDDVVVIEWADRIAGLLPDEHLQVDFTYLDETRRRLCFVAHTTRYVELLTACYSDLIPAPGWRASPCITANVA